MRIDKHILSVGLLLASLVWALWFVFAGFGNHQDPLYWLYKYETLEGGWMAVGTLLTGGALVRLFGAQLLPLRLFGWLCTTAAVALPYCCLLDREKSRANLHWLALTYLLMGYGAFQEFSPGTLSVLLLSALWVTAVRSNGNPRWNMLTAVLLGLAISVRLPNILALPVLLLLWKRRSLWTVPVAAATAAVVYLLGWVLVTPAAADAAMNSHQLTKMVWALWDNSGRLLGYSLMAVGVLACYRLTRLKPQFSGLAVGFVLALFVVETMKPTQWYNIDMTYLLSALCLVLAFATKQRSLYIGVALLAVATLGTDTAWLKLFPAVLCLLPVAATCFAEEGRRYLWYALAVLSVCVAIRMSTNSIGKTDLTKATAVATVAPYHYIAIRPAEEASLRQYRADYDTLSTQSSTVLALGQEMHLVRAVTGCEAARFNEFWSNIFDSVYTAKYRSIVEAERPVVICTFSPQFKTKPVYRDKESRMEQMLLQQGYRAIDRSQYRYMIYIPAEEKEL